MFQKCAWCNNTYLVPLLQLMVRELSILPEVLQHLWPQLTVLFSHGNRTVLAVFSLDNGVYHNSQASVLTCWTVIRTQEVRIN